MTVLLLKNINVFDVNMSSNEFVEGMVSPEAFIGFSSLLMRRLKKNGNINSNDFYNIKVLPIIHHLDVSEGRISGEFNPSSKAPYEIVEKAIGYINFSLLIDFQCRIKSFDNSIESVVVDLLPERFAGGILSSLSPTGDFSDPECEVVTDISGSIFKSIPQGWVLSHPTKVDNVPIYIEDIAQFAEIVDIMLPSTPRLKKGWMIPLHVGYKLIGDINFAVPKHGARDKSVPHMFATPIVSIGEFVSTNNKYIEDLTEDHFDQHFWNWNNLVKGQETYKLFNQFYSSNLA